MKSVSESNQQAEDRPWLREKVYDPKRKRTADLVKRAVDSPKQLYQWVAAFDAPEPIFSLPNVLPVETLHRLTSGSEPGTGVKTKF